MDDETLAAFAGSEISGLSGRSQHSDAAFSDGTAVSDGGSYEEVVSQPPAPQRSGVGEDASQEPKRRRLDSDEVSAPIAPSSHLVRLPGSSPARGMSAQLDGKEGQGGMSSPAQEVKAAPVGGAPGSPPLEDAEEEEEAGGGPSTPDSPAAPEVGRPAASGASDARDSLAGNALAALAADADADGETAQSQLTPLLGTAAQWPSQPDSSPPPDTASISAPCCSPPGSAAAGYPAEGATAAHEPPHAAQEPQAALHAAGGGSGSAAGEGAAAAAPEAAADSGGAAPPEEGTPEQSFTPGSSTPLAAAQSLPAGGLVPVLAGAQQAEQQAKEKSAVQPAEKGRRAGIERQQTGSAAASKKLALKPWR